MSQGVQHLLSDGGNRLTRGRFRNGNERKEKDREDQTETRCRDAFLSTPHMSTVGLVVSKSQERDLELYPLNVRQ